MTQTLWADAHQGGAGAIVVNADERHKQLVPEGENFLNMGSSDFVNFWASDTKLGTLVHFGTSLKTK